MMLKKERSSPRLVAGLLQLFILGLAGFTAFALVVRADNVLPQRRVQRDAQHLAQQEADTGLPAPRSTWLLSRLALLPNLWRQKTLVGVVIENHQTARPFQQGLSQALLVQEYFVEGMITRFVALYDVNNLPDTIGPIRSLRPYFLDAALPYTALIIHAGGSPEALERAAANTKIEAVNALRYDGSLFYRDEEAPAPHDLFTTAEGVEDILSGAVLRSVAWPPYSTGGAFGGEPATTIAVDFRSAVHDVTYTYGAWSRTYTRMNGNTKTPATPSNVIVLTMPILGIGEHGRLELGAVGTGDMLLFRSGLAYQGTYRKAAEDAPFEFFDTEGNPLMLAAGQTWITVVEDISRVSWE